MEPLEGRLMLSVTADVRYTYDTKNFFNTQDKKDLFEKAVNEIVGRLGDTLDAISSGGGNSWTASFPHPGTGSTQQIPNLSVAANQLIFYVGGRELGSTLGMGGAGAFSASGSSAFLNTVKTRGETGVNNDTDFASWGGAITFDSTTNWHFGETTAGLGNDESDFYSVALHEITHALGFGGADSWDAQIVSGKFAGPASVAEYDGSGNVPLNGGRDHWAEGTTDGGDEAAMDPTVTVGTRKVMTALDFAGLNDIGWEVGTKVSIEATDNLARETGPNRGVFRITRDGDTTNTLRVRLTFKGTAINGTDYDEVATSVRIGAGKTFANVSIWPIDDALNEGTERVQLYIKANAAYTIDPDAKSARVNVRDNDASSVRASIAHALTVSPHQSLFSTQKLGAEPNSLEDLIASHS
jgi:hypothetical protein